MGSIVRKATGSSVDPEDEGLIEDEGDGEEGQRNRRKGRVNDGGDRTRTRNHNFDTTLPGTHSYLGDDLEEVRGRTVHEDNTVVTIPLLPLPGVVLVPGEVIPLHLFQQQLIAAIRRLADTDKTFGVVTYSMEPDHSPGFSEIGCTAELYSMKNEVDDQAGLSVLRALARGRQRFKVMGMHRDVVGILMAKVRILPEINVPRCLSGARPATQNKFCCSPTEQDDVVKTAVDRQGNVIKSINLVVNKQVDRFTAAHLTQWPPWVYKLYDAELLKEQVIKELHSWNDTLQAASLPTDATELSYWVAQNLPLDNTMRMHLLGVTCPIHRLRSELAIMKKCAILCCKNCMKQIARKEEVFSMSSEGPLGAYVNPGGHVHETLTLYKANNLRLVGYSSTEHSWFPGYAWTIAQCHGCASHMGWKFTAAKKKLTPQKFWGLCRSSLIPSFSKTTDKANVDTASIAGDEQEEEELILEGW
ncbi:protein cereblon-like isoform X2 [Littorina saxatilis]|uniref:protein cereblon-like isoform X2 n=1 Tax=Littorina saxatilis TaxID=31220 RepID=UPI0038B4A896